MWLPEHLALWKKKLGNKVHTGHQIEGFTEIIFLCFPLCTIELKLLGSTHSCGKRKWKHLKLLFFSGIVTKRWGDLLTVACEVMPAVFFLRCSENEYFFSLQTYFIRLFIALYLSRLIEWKSEAVKCYNYLSTCPSIHAYLSFTIISCCFLFFIFSLCI